MTRKPHPPPTQEERARAREAAAALRAAIADRSTMGKPDVFHVDLSRPRRGQWWMTWANLPGFVRVQCTRDGVRYRHDLLPGWEYTRAEVRAEMIPDLEALAERGERPLVSTRTA